MVKNVLLAGVLWTLAAFVTPSLADHWQRHDGRWYMWNAPDARWYYTDGEHWYYHRTDRWNYYPFDARFGEDWEIERDDFGEVEIEDDRLPRFAPPPAPRPRVEIDD